MKQSGRIRVLLDTCVIRGIIHKTGPQLDIDAIAASLAAVAITLPDTGVVELTSQLEDNRIPFAQWQEGICKIDQIRDREWPVLPSGRERAMLAGLCPRDLQALEAAQRHCVSVWKLLSNIDEHTAMDIAVVYDDGGQAVRIQSTPQTTRMVKEAARYSWILFVDEYVRHTNGRTPTLEEVTADILGGAEHVDKTIPDLNQRLDLFLKAIAQLVQMATKPNGGYRPGNEKRRGDVFDIMLLMSLNIPAVVVTTDAVFLNRVRQLSSLQLKQVVSVDEFNAHLASGTLASCLQSHLTLSTTNSVSRPEARPLLQLLADRSSAPAGYGPIPIVPMIRWKSFVHNSSGVSHMTWFSCFVSKWALPNSSVRHV
jgi:hypothetical protein